MATKATAKSPRKATAPQKATPPRKATGRQAAPRKAATRPRAAGTANGDPTPVNGAGAVPAPETSPASNGQVRESALPQDNSGQIQSPYPAGTATYTFFPQLGADGQPTMEALPPIIIPKFSTLNPSRKWLWAMYDKGPLIQAFEWMKLGDVPEHIQERIVELPDEEYERFWDGWFGEARVTQGE